VIPVACEGLSKRGYLRCKSAYLRVCIRQGVSVCAPPTTTSAPTTTTSTTTIPEAPQCASDADCSDGNVCNGAETCSAGQCVAGTMAICPDGSPAPWTGKAYNPTSGDFVNMNAILCRTGTAIWGSWSCSPGTVACPVVGGPVSGTLLGTSFSLIGTNDLRDTQHPFQCQFTGSVVGTSISGNMTCTDNSTLISRLTPINASFGLNRCN
jgi:hypothetical protein